MKIIVLLCLIYSRIIAANERHVCDRKCVKDVQLTCNYTFVIEYYYTMSVACKNCPYNTKDCYNKHCITGDGVPRTVMVVNKTLPGPSIIACLDDEIIVNVINTMPSDSVTIHWHGILQKETPYMDGVPYVTQCPIGPGNRFRYKFKATESGSHFWHAHQGMLRSDGIFGPLIIRTPDERNQLYGSYDHDVSEHVITINDWFHSLALDKFENLKQYKNGNNKPEAILVNGFGRNATFLKNKENIFTPIPRFTIEKNQRYRFRLIDAGSIDCPIEISIDNHKLIVISSDGSDFHPIEVTSLVVFAGERYDFIVKGDREPDLYWIRFKGLTDCESNLAHVGAVLQYAGADNKKYPDALLQYDRVNDGIQLNSIDVGTRGKSIVLSDLKSFNRIDETLKAIPDFVYYISIDSNLLYNPHFLREDKVTPQINHITYRNLPFPLLSQRDLLDDTMFCNETTVKNCTAHFCQCTYVVKLPLDKIIEFIIIDEGHNSISHHPFHMHGYKLRVIAFGKLGRNTTVEDVKKLYQNGEIKMNLDSAPVKDTIQIPSGGYAIVRFKTINPGYWIFHCHLEDHILSGMSMVFKIGEHNDMVDVPKTFPTCNDYF